MRQRGPRLRQRAESRLSAAPMEAAPVYQEAEQQKDLYRLKGVSFGGAGIFFWWELGSTDRVSL